MPANRSTLTVREFLALAVRLAGVSSSLIGNSDCASDTIRLQLDGATIEITFGSGGFDLPRESIVAWVSKAARAVTHYYGVFPVPLTRLRVTSSEERRGAFGGETWGSDPPFTRIFVGRHTTRQQLHGDWLITHEFVHIGFPDVAEQHHWIEEGIAT